MEIGMRWINKNKLKLKGSINFMSNNIKITKNKIKNKSKIKKISCKARKKTTNNIIGQYSKMKLNSDNTLKIY